ncbi:MAG: hypothetical protein JXA50_04085 [Deltaproteobacteria bacterium]|nr:hypothetical protein [Deltaproteobacteria bacterium]
MQLHIIYTETYMLLSKRSYGAWREIQEEFENYKASLGSWEDDEVIQYLSDEYSDLYPSAKEQVEALLSGPDDVRIGTSRR